MSLVPKLDLEALLHEPLPLDTLGFADLGIFGDLILSIDINKKKATPDPPDDDFDTGTGLDLTGARHSGAIPWNIVTGAAGTVALLASGNNGFEFLANEAALAMQVDFAGADVELLMNYELPINSSIIAKVHPSFLLDQSVVNNEIQVGIGLNNNDTGPAAGTWLEAIIDAHILGQEYRIFGWDGTTTSLDQVQGDPSAHAVYLRIARDATTNYYVLYSIGGVVWAVGGILAIGSALDNVWIKGLSAAAFGDPTPIQVFEWIRQGTNNLFPWDVVV